MTSPADIVVDGFADELDRLGLPDRLEKLAFLGFGKKAPPAAPPTGFGKVMDSLKKSPVGRVLKWPLKAVFSVPGMVAFGTIGGAGLMGKNKLRERAISKGLA